MQASSPAQGSSSRGQMQWPWETPCCSPQVCALGPRRPSAARSPASARAPENPPGGVRGGGGGLCHHRRRREVLLRETSAGAAWTGRRVLDGAGLELAAALGDARRVGRVPLKRQRPTGDRTGHVGTCGVCHGPPTLGPVAVRLGQAAFRPGTVPARCETAGVSAQGGRWPQGRALGEGLGAGSALVHHGRRPGSRQDAGREAGVAE